MIPKFLRFLVRILFFFIGFLYQLPQSIFGLVLIILYRNKLTADNDTWKEWSVIAFYIKDFCFSGISLGSFILIRDSCKELPMQVAKIENGQIYLKQVAFARTNNRTKIYVNLMHEYGHVIQSRILGPLYPFIIGIKSIINDIRAGQDRKISEIYYSLYPEYWANRCANLIQEADNAAASWHLVKRT